MCRNFNNRTQKITFVYTVFECGQFASFNRSIFCSDETENWNYSQFWEIFFVCFVFLHFFSFCWIQHRSNIIWDILLWSTSPIKTGLVFKSEHRTTDLMEAGINDPMKTRFVFKIHVGRIMETVVVFKRNHWVMAPAEGEIMFKVNLR